MVSSSLRQPRPVWASSAGAAPASLSTHRPGRRVGKPGLGALWEDILSVLLNFQCEHEPSLTDAARALGVSRSAIDAEFGIIAIDPDQQLYTVRVEEAAAGEHAAANSVRGPFSDPRISPMG